MTILLYSSIVIIIILFSIFIHHKNSIKKSLIKKEQDEKIKRINSIKNGALGHRNLFNNDVNFLNYISGNKYGIDASNLICDYKTKTEEINKYFETINNIAVDKKISSENEDVLEKLSSKIKDYVLIFNRDVSLIRKKYESCKQLEKEFDLFNEVKDENEKSFEIFYEKIKIIHNKLSKSKTFKKIIDEDAYKNNFYSHIKHAKSIVKQAKDLLLINKDYEASIKMKENASYNYKKAFSIKSDLENFCKNFDNINFN